MSNSSNSVSIPVSDNEFDEVERMRVRARRKRKKLGSRVKNELARRVFRMMLRYWLVVFFLIAAGLLIFEATRIGRKSRMEAKSELGDTTRPTLGDSVLGTDKKSGLDNKPDGNLNRLDPVTRMVAGVRERKFSKNLIFFSMINLIFLFREDLQILVMRIGFDLFGVSLF